MSLLTRPKHSERQHERHYLRSTTQSSVDEVVVVAVDVRHALSQPDL